MHYITILFFFFFYTLLSLSLSTLSVLVTTSSSFASHRRLLHQPFVPVDSHLPPPPITQPPFSSNPKYPFSSSSPTKPHFFPLYHSPPPSPPSPANTFPTFPANISSLVLPQSSSKSISRNLVAIAVSLSLLSATLIALFLLYHRRQHLQHRHSEPNDTLRLVPPNATPSDAHRKHPTTSSTSSSEFLYLGTLNQSDLRSSSNSVNLRTAGSPDGKMGSPELHPLPPLPRNSFFSSTFYVDDDNEEFFSPRGSSGTVLEDEIFENQNLDFLTTSYQRSNSGSSGRVIFEPEVLENQNFGLVTTSYQRSNHASPTLFLSSPKSFLSSSTKTPERNIESPIQRFPIKLPPSPPPLPPARFWETRLPVNSVKTKNPNEVFGIPKPKLKPLHWDKVRASSDRATVWDHLKSSSFQLNEEMIETLFMVNSTNLNSGKNHNPNFLMPLMNQDHKFLLDPRKSQNISILLRAVNLTIDEVCEALWEGNTDSMGAELLESLIKMAPTKEEEHKLKEFKDEEVSPFKLGPAEKFLKALLEIPFAFKRIESMLYITNFDTEVEYLHSSFQTIEAACEELRNNRMFMKLLEAVLRTGNRMNIGTNRGDAHAFKLDTLLKLVDVKGTDGKTTLLHFVVEEMVSSEASRLANSTNKNHHEGKNPTTIPEEKKLGLKVVYGLIGELANVKKVAAMDYDALISEVPKLSAGMGKVREVLKLDEGLCFSSRKFSESMKGFLDKSEKEIMKIQVQASVALTKVKEITEYFHGNSSKEEAHPFRIFMVVRDFLLVLDRVCKEVGGINERNMQASSIRQFPPPVFPMFNVNDGESSSTF